MGKGDFHFVGSGVYCCLTVYKEFPWAGYGMVRFPSSGLLHFVADNSRGQDGEPEMCNEGGIPKCGPYPQEVCAGGQGGWK